MSKKLIIFIQLVVCLAAVIIISLYGRNPELWKDYQLVEDIYFTYEDEEVVNGYEIELEYGTTNFQLTWVIAPEDATIKTVRFYTDNTNVIVDEEGYVTFSTDEGAAVYMSTTDNSLKTIYIQLTILPSNNGGEIPL